MLKPTGKMWSAGFTRFVLVAVLGVGFAATSGCQKACFVAGTPVATPAGPVPIEDLRAGDAVVSYDAATGRTVVGRVVRLWRKVGRFRQLSLADGQRLGVTAEHPFFDARRQRFTPAGELGPAARPVRLQGGGDGTVRGPRVARFASGGWGSLYNISVEPHPHYFAAGLLVHNKTPRSIDGASSDVAASPEVCEPVIAPVEACLRRQYSSCSALSSAADRAACNEEYTKIARMRQLVGTPVCRESGLADMSSADRALLRELEGRRCPRWGLAPGTFCRQCAKRPTAEECREVHAEVAQCRERLGCATSTDRAIQLVCQKIDMGWRRS